jgi:anti-sigma regulatory factor (Ser/Thr protein kinase)
MAAQSDTTLISALELAPLPTAIPCFRLHAAAVLREWRLPRDLVADAEMLVSELMTNAAGARLSLAASSPGQAPA